MYQISSDERRLDAFMLVLACFRKEERVASGECGRHNSTSNNGGRQLGDIIVPLIMVEDS